MLVRRSATAVVIACSVVAVVTYVAVALLRIGHPFELQWMEGGAVGHVDRVLSGRSLYAEPSLDFVAYVYPPFYWWVSAAVAWVVGEGFLPLRLVSFTASLGTMAALGVITWRETHRWLAVFVAVGLFAGAYRVTGAWYDIGRVDSLFIFLLVCSIGVVASATTWRGALAAGVLLALSALTKQTAILATAPLVAYLVWRRPRIGIVYALAFAVPWGLVSLVLHLTSDGWYGFTTVELLAGHPIEDKFWVDYPLRDLGAHLWPAFLLIAVAAWQIFRQRRAEPPDPPERAERNNRPAWPERHDQPPWPERNNWVPYAAAAVGMVGSAWISRLHSGGYDDVLIPAFTAIALLAGLAVARLPDHPLVWLGLAAGCLVQAWLLGYPPRAQIPTSTDVAAGRALVAELRSMPGDVLVVSHPWYVVMAGKPAHAQAAAISDIERGKTSEHKASDLLNADIAEDVRQRRFSAIVFDSPDDHRGFPPDFDKYYRPIEPPVLGPDEPGLRPLTDLPVRPAEWWVPR